MLGSAWQGVARPGPVGLGKARRGRDNLSVEVRSGMAIFLNDLRPGEVRSGMARSGAARSGMAG
jgi:hypothetical protein